MKWGNTYKVPSIVQSKDKPSRSISQQLSSHQAAKLVKKPPSNAGDARDVGWILGSGRSPGGGHGNPLQYYCLENSTDRGAWRGLQSTASQRVRCDWAFIGCLSIRKRIRGRKVAVKKIINIIFSIKKNCCKFFSCSSICCKKHGKNTWQDSTLRC